MKEAATSRRLIAIDWGTSNFRAFLVDRDSGACLGSRRSDAGLRSMTSREYPYYCAAQVDDWRDDAQVPVYLAGMVGARRGWSEAPQLELPVDASALARHVVAAPGMANAWIVPGVKVVRDAHVDVMRGEEVQAFGALALAGRQDALCCLPGTHSKWATLTGGRLVDFTTMMTGELYHAVCFHTLPGEPAREASREGGEVDVVAFRQGVQVAGHPAGLLHALFEARSRYLYAGLEGEQVGSFLSGVMIGHEVRTQVALHGTDTPVMVVGSCALNHLYRLAIDFMGGTVREIDSDHATLAGICALASRHQQGGD
ncbi:2-dehydro-3-deoxygalactonokinase [Halomonas urmiana]|uniref:2-dehydro-3-deoxygalactonokinase n=1 Tax=Halomonas urmiana TaxID=490901 RepID=A0A5R8MEG2_9GAMM|nr:2-dehydro-3-deoxygalactonokinase [Halomonas urmiana]TLF48275.1 2-dehydro-3-deoxygalactonokinase [Halomonas urmiana]